MIPTRLTHQGLTVLLLATVCGFALTGCSSADEALSRDLSAPERVDVLAPPVAPDPNDMHPALQIARSRGLKTNVYFNEELQQAVARLHGMEETLGRLQSDLQGTAMAMQRVEMMRQEVEALNVKIQSIQERLIYAGPQLAAAPEGDVQAQPVPMMDGGPEHIASDTATQPTPLMGDMAKPNPTELKPQKAQPIVDEGAAKAAKSSPAPVKTGNGVYDVRIGAHADSVRIVLDVGGSDYAFTTNLDNGEKLLTVELPKTAWTAAKTQTVSNNPLVASFTAQPSDKGTIAAFVLKGDTKIIDSKTLKGTGGKPTRIVIDLSK